VNKIFFSETKNLEILGSVTGKFLVSEILGSVTGKFLVSEILG
jgi:hypothetical protein